MKLLNMQLIDNIGQYITLRDNECLIVGRADNGHLYFRNKLQQFYTTIPYLPDFIVDRRERSRFYGNYITIIGELQREINSSIHNLDRPIADFVNYMPEGTAAMRLN